MSNIYVYVDNSNVFIEGCRLSAVRNSHPGCESIFDAMNNGIVDNGWRLDYGELYQLILGSNEIAAANLWGSPPPGDSFWDMVKSSGFSVKTYDKNKSFKEKKVDVAIAHAITRDAYKPDTISKGKDVVLLVAGDSDFVPVVEDLVAEGHIVWVSFWGHASSELKRVATKFINMDSYHRKLTDQNRST